MFVNLAERDLAERIVTCTTCCITPWRDQLLCIASPRNYECIPVHHARIVTPHHAPNVLTRTTQWWCMWPAHDVALQMSH